MSPSTNGQALTDPLRRLDANQEHDQLVRDALHSHATSRTGWTTLAGQLCAYGGVGFLTCGTVLVMWSYFGGPAKYMPTGWLMAAVGQMLLFLGVVTLISSGMEQTINEVSWRIDHLAEEIHHLGIVVDDFEQEYRQERQLRRKRRKHRPEDESARDAA